MFIANLEIQSMLLYNLFKQTAVRHLWTVGGIKVVKLWFGLGMENTWSRRTWAKIGSFTI